MKNKLIKSAPYLVLGFSVLVFLALVLKRISFPIWFDEGYSAYLVKGSFGEIWGLTAVDVHPPFYYYLLKIWSLMFGTSLIALRAISVFFGVASIVLLFFLVKHWFGKKPAMFASLLMAVSPFLIRYGMEMRMYMVILFIVLLASYMLTLAVEKNQKRYWVFYAVLVALGMYTHYFTACVWLTHVIYLLFIFRKDAKRLVPAVLSYVGAVVLYVPWVPSLLSQMDSISGGFWIPPVTGETPVSFLTNIFLFKSAGELAGWSVLLAILFVGVYVLVTKIAYKEIAKADRKYYLFLFLMFVLPPLALLGVSLVYKPMFVDRYLVPSSIIAWVIIGVSLAFCPVKKVCERCVIGFATFVVLLTAGVGVLNVLDRNPESYVADIIRTVKDEKDDTPILADDIWVFLGAAIYTSEENPVYGTLETTFTNGWGSEEPMKYYEGKLDRAKSQVYKTLDDFLAENKTFWYVTENPEKLPAGNFDVVKEVKTEHHTAMKLKAV